MAAQTVPETSLAPVTFPAKAFHLLSALGLCASSSEARRQIQGGGVRLDGEKLTDVNRSFSAAYATATGLRRLRVLAAPGPLNWRRSGPVAYRERESKDAAAAATCLSEFSSAADKAAKTKVLKKNASSRLKSRLALKVGALTKPA